MGGFWSLAFELGLHYGFKDSLHVRILLALFRLINAYGEISILVSVLLTESQPLRACFTFTLFRLCPMPSVRPLIQTLRKLRVVKRRSDLSLTQLQIVDDDLIMVNRSALSGKYHHLRLL